MRPGGAGVVPVRDRDPAEARMREGGHVAARPDPVGPGHCQPLVGVDGGAAAERGRQRPPDAGRDQHDVGGQVAVRGGAHDVAVAVGVDARDRAPAEEPDAERGEHAHCGGPQRLMLPSERLHRLLERA